MTGFQDKIALVTGATRGLGRAIAAALARCGARVIGTATSEGGAAAITQAFEKEGWQGQGIVLNVTEPASIEAALQRVRTLYGDPHILVNNAGITRDNLLLRMKPEEWNAVIETDLTAVFRLTHACLRAMLKARWGRIINISSVVGCMGNAGQANYAAAKAGLIAFGKSLAQEIASRGITVNAIAPGFIDTDMTHALSEAQREALVQKIPLQRVGRPEEVAAAVVFLASDEAAYITGETLHVNGGLYMA